MIPLRILTRSFSNIVIGNRVVTCARNSNTLIAGSRTFTAGILERSVAGAGIKCFCRRFHVSRRLDFPVTHVVLGLIGGRMVRFICRSLPKPQIVRRILHREDVLAIIPGIIIGWVLYTINYEETPITGRKRWIPFSHSRIKEILKPTQQKTIDKHFGKNIAVVHPDYQQVNRVLEQLLKSNKLEIDGVHWKPFIVNDDSLINAFVSVNGQIYVTTGMLRAFPNDDALAVILAHEMSHTILEHQVEKTFLNTLVFYGSATIAALVPGLIKSTIACLIYVFTIILPYWRMFETEADEVGTILAAKACYDIRVAPRLFVEDSNRRPVHPPQWILDHPSSANRAKRLEALVPEVMKLREKCNCPPLPMNPTYNFQQQMNLRFK